MGTFLFTAAVLVAVTMLLLLRPWRPGPFGRGTTLVLAIGMPLAAIGGYALLGAPVALLAPPAMASNAAHQASEIDRMVSGLAARLEKNPNDPKGWAMLGRSYHAMGRLADAQAAFERRRRAASGRDAAGGLRRRARFAGRRQPRRAAAEAGEGGAAARAGPCNGAVARGHGRL